MKKIFNILLLPATMLMLFACNYNDQFDGLDEKEQLTNVAQYQYTIVDADFATIAAGAKGTPNEAAAAQANKDKAFSDAAPADVLIPYLLKAKYYSVDKNSSANVTYNFKENRDETLNKLSQPAYTLTDADYKLVWGDNYVTSLAPSKSPATQLPIILNADFPDAEDGDYQNIEYNYSPNEPVMDVAEVFYLKADFEDIASGSGVAVAIDGWINKDLKGNAAWQCRAYSGNQYAQATSNATNSENEIWLISKKVDLSDAISPEFTFDVTAGYYNYDCLSIQVSENFDGTEAGITTATWTDITSNFTLPTGPASGYGTLGSAGVMDFSAYVGKNVYIAFKYSGDSRTGETAKSTTFQIDNVKISEEKVTMTIAGVSKQYVVYQFTGGQWKQAPSSIVILQPADYTAMGQSYLSTSTAANYLPQWLAQKYPYAQEGTLQTVVYKSTSGNTYYADNYLLTDGKWALQSLTVSKTEQFIFAGWDNGGWVFDPTVFYTMEKPDHQIMCTYVLNDPVLGVYKRGTYTNEEWYYGFNAYYGNLSLRLGGSATSSRDVPCSKDNDAELHSLSTNEEKIALLWERSKEGMNIFLQLRFPDAKQNVAGIQVFYNIQIDVYYPDGVTNTTVKYIYKYKVLTSGSGGTAPTFEFVSVEPKQ